MDHNGSSLADASAKDNPHTEGFLGTLLVGLWIGFFEGWLVAWNEGFPLNPFSLGMPTVGLRTAGLAAALAVGAYLVLRKSPRPAFWARVGTLTLVAGYQIFKSTAVYEQLPATLTRAAVSMSAALVVSFLLFSIYQRLSVAIQRKLQTLVIACAFLCWIFPPATPSSESQPWAGEETERPANVVLLVIDTLRADRLSAYGHSIDGKATSPALDQIAADGTLFRNAYAQAPWTRPSVASMMSGLYPQSHGVATPFDRMSSKLKTLPSMMKERGYQCAAFSANPQVSPTFGFDAGFDYFWSISGSFQDQTCASYLWDRGSLAARRVILMLLGSYDRGLPNADADRVNDEIRGWLNTQDAAVPRFLYFHYLDPHDPYEAPEDLLFDGGLSEMHVDESPLFAPTDHPPYPVDGYQQTELPEATRQDLLRRYDAEIRFVDDRIGKQLQWMEERGYYQPERDYLIITSDHGEEFFEHQQWLHGRSEFDEMVNVPLIVRGPGVPSALEVELPVQLIDILPTVAGWTGPELEFQHHGQPLPFAKSALATDLGVDFGRHFVYSHRPRPDHPINMIRSGALKLIDVHDGEKVHSFLFHLDRDPREQDNLLDHPSNPLEDETAALRLRMDALRTLAEISGAGAETVELTEAMRQQLQALGYLDQEEPKTDESRE
jgi:arylsulfatase A-like enzyme